MSRDSGNETIPLRAARHGAFGRRSLLATPSLLLAPAAAAQAFPARPIRLAVNSTPGGSLDILTRTLAAGMSEELGQPVVVENRPGAGGNIMMDYVARAAPDGHVLGSGNVTQWLVNPLLYRNLPFDVRTDFSFLGIGWDMVNVLVVPAQHVPARTVPEFVAWAKARPQGVFGLSPGVGSSAHMLGALFAKRQGFQYTHLPFRGFAESGPAFLRGDAQFGIDNLASWMPLIRTGEAIAMAVTSNARWPALPNIPTMREIGLPEFEVMVGGGIVAPGQTPAAVVELLTAAVSAAAQRDAMKRQCETLGAFPPGPGTMRQRLEREAGFWAELVQVSGARLE